MARPLKQINTKLVEQLATIGCSNTEIATIVECSHDTLTRRFAYELSKGRASRKMALRKKQWESAMNGNIAMQIWLGKQELGQSDKVEQTIKDEETVIDRDAQARETRERLIREFGEEKLEVISKPH